MSSVFNLWFENSEPFEIEGCVMLLDLSTMSKNYNEHNSEYFELFCLSSYQIYQSWVKGSPNQKLCRAHLDHPSLLLRRTTGPKSSYHYPQIAHLLPTCLDMEIDERVKTMCQT